MFLGLGKKFSLFFISSDSDSLNVTNSLLLFQEEDIEIISGVTIPEILQWIRNGEMNLVGGYGCLLAIEKLRELGEYQ